MSYLNISFEFHWCSVIKKWAPNNFCSCLNKKKIKISKKNKKLYFKWTPFLFKDQMQFVYFSHGLNHSMVLVAMIIHNDRQITYDLASRRHGEEEYNDKVRRLTLGFVHRPGGGDTCTCRSGLGEPGGPPNFGGGL